MTVEGPQHLLDFLGGTGQSGDHFGGGEPQHRGNLRVVGDPLDRGRIPFRGLQVRDQFPRFGFGAVHRNPFVGAVLHQPEGLSQAGERLFTTEQLPGPQDGQHQVQLLLVAGGQTENVQAVPNLDVLDLAQPSVDMEQHVVEHVFLGAFGQPEVVVHLRGAHQGPDLLTDGG